MPEYTFTPYDVLQVLSLQQGNPSGGEWLDYATLRTEDDARHAVRYVNGLAAQGSFRIVDMAHRVVKLSGLETA